MKIIKYILLTLAFIGGLWFLRPHSSTAPAFKYKVETKVATLTNEREIPPASSQVNQPTSIDKIKISEISLLTTDNLKDMNQYQKIKAKVFLTETEKRARLQIISNVVLIQNLKNYLLTPKAAEVGSWDYQQHILAIDLLIESSVDGHSSEATAAVLSIIEDKQIEDVNLSNLQRQSLAEVKADLLYIWTAKRPDQIQIVDRSIPGPVTATIWANAKVAQEQNRLESLTAN